MNNTQPLTLQERFNIVVNYAFDGWHHVNKNAEKSSKHTNAVYFTVFHGISTYDFDQLTKLVLACHAVFVRCEIVQSGPHQLGIWLSERAPKKEGDSFADRHPSLDDIITIANELKQRGYTV